MDHLKMHFLLKIVVFHCHVSFEKLIWDATLQWENVGINKSKYVRSSWCWLLLGGLWHPKDVFTTGSCLSQVQIDWNSLSDSDVRISKGNTYSNHWFQGRTLSFREDTTFVLWLVVASCLFMVFSLKKSRRERYPSHLFSQPSRIPKKSASKPAG